MDVKRMTETNMIAYGWQFDHVPLRLDKSRTSIPNAWVANSIGRTPGLDQRTRLPGVNRGRYTRYMQDNME